MVWVDNILSEMLSGDQGGLKSSSHPLHQAEWCSWEGGCLSYFPQMHHRGLAVDPDLPQLCYTSMHKSDHHHPHFTDEDC